MISFLALLAGLALGSIMTRALIPPRKVIVREPLPLPYDRAYSDGVETETDGAARPRSSPHPQEA